MARLARKVGLLAPPAQLTFNDIVNVPFETPAVSWTIALVLQLGVPMPDSTLTIEVGVEVIDGKLGIAAYGGGNAAEDKMTILLPCRLDDDLWVRPWPATKPVSWRTKYRMVSASDAPP